MGKKLKEFDVVFESGEDGYVAAFVPALPGCHTQGRTIAEAVRNVKEAISLYLEVASESRARSKSKFMGIRRIGVPLPA
ncbi:MAG: type II toxin-antitoxin system HicB family antitoxin [Candidatus Micrarchaeia archaeon]